MITAFSATHNSSKVYVDVKTFIKAQHFCESCKQLAAHLDQTVPQVKSRIKYLIRKGYGSKLRPYSDLIEKRGRQSLDVAMVDIEDYDDSVGNGDATVKPIE